MEFLDALAQTFSVTRFDAGIFLCIGALSITAYYFLTLHQIFEAAFGAMVGLGIYILVSVLLLGNPSIGSSGGLFPFGFSVFIVSLAVYLIFILAILLPIHGGLLIAEPTHPTLYTVVYFFTTVFFIISMLATIVYMIDQVYVFRPGTIFNLIHDTRFYTDSVKTSVFYNFVIKYQDVILPLGIMLMLYKILLSNIINAALLSVWYNLLNIGFYKKKEDTSYRVEFHEVGGNAHDHNDGGHNPQTSTSGHDHHTAGPSHH